VLNALGELIFEAIQKQAAEANRPRGAGGQPGAPPANVTVVRPAPQMGKPAPVRPAVAAPSVAMGRTPDAIPYDSLPQLEPLVSLAAPAYANPLLKALRGGPALIGGIIVAQVLGPPPSLRPHAAPTDTL
jgi:hypothetical protein